MKGIRSKNISYHLSRRNIFHIALCYYTSKYTIIPIMHLYINAVFVGCILVYSVLTLNNLLFASSFPENSYK